MPRQNTPLNNTDADIFLKQLNFDKRVENNSWTTKELRQILRDVIHDYLNRKVDKDFVIDIGSAIHDGIFHDNEALMSTTCLLTDMNFEKFRQKYSGIDQAFREALSFIEE